VVLRQLCWRNEDALDTIKLSVENAAGYTLVMKS
jgi:hypothetical protein